jgi:oxygen-independent coproporphyrinogen-3 oxidase
MCDLALDAAAVAHRFGEAAAPVVREALAVRESGAEGLIAPTDGGFRITEAGRPFARTIAARFDAYLSRGAARHSAAV